MAEPGWPRREAVSALGPAWPSRASEYCRLGRHSAPGPGVTAALTPLPPLPLDEGFEAVVVVGQGLRESEELGDGVFGAGDAHLDPIVADRHTGRQRGDPAGEGLDGDRDADPDAAGLAEHAQHPVAAGGFVPDGACLLEPPELAE